MRRPEDPASRYFSSSQYQTIQANSRNHGGFKGSLLDCNRGEKSEHDGQIDDIDVGFNTVELRLKNTDKELMADDLNMTMQAPTIPRLDLDKTEKYTDSSKLFVVAPPVEGASKLIRDEFSVTITNDSSINQDDNSRQDNEIEIVQNSDLFCKNDQP